jgi:hypothetical protein
VELDKLIFFSESLKLTDKTGHRTGDHHINPNAPSEEELAN